MYFSLIFFNFFFFNGRGLKKRFVFQSTTAREQLLRQGEPCPSVSTPYSSPRNRLHWKPTGWPSGKGFREPQLSGSLLPKALAEASHLGLPLPESPLHSEFSEPWLQLQCLPVHDLFPNRPLFLLPGIAEDKAISKRQSLWWNIRALDWLMREFWVQTPTHLLVLQELTLITNCMSHIVLSVL